MKEFIHKHIISKPLVATLAGLILVIILVFGISLYFLSRTINSLKRELASSFTLVNQRVASLESGLASTSQEFSQQLLAQQNQSNDFQETISDIAGTVGTLEKLSKTDRELLQKYSRVYFLSDNYVPMRLKSIPEEYLKDSKLDLQFHGLALSYLKDMLGDAQDDDINLKVISAYRSFGTQSSLKSSYLMTYGSGSNQFSADQGYSEHQLGTTVDLVTDVPGTDLVIGFEQTSAYDWLTKNAYKYGFILSYPKNNAYYQYEPWHWRFVGVKLATKLHNDDINFSDMDQRDIDKYLVKIFD